MPRPLSARQYEAVKTAIAVGLLAGYEVGFSVGD
jgi:hypothetical protein